MSHEKDHCPKCSLHLNTHTLECGEGGFRFECNRDPALGIDACAVKIWKLLTLEETHDADMAKLKSNHAIELSAKQKLLDDQMIELQSARAKADDVERILQVQLGHARTAMEATHKAAIKTVEEAKDEAMRILREGQQAAYNELENRYNASQAMLRGTEEKVAARVADIAQLEAQLSAQRTTHAEELAAADRRYRELDDRLAETLKALAKAETERDAALAAKAKAESHARAAEGEEGIAKDEVRTMKVELNQLRAMARRPGQAELYRLQEGFKWFVENYGSLPADVEKQILVGIPVVSENETAPPPVVEAPEDDSIVPHGSEASDSVVTATPAESAIEPPSTSIVDDAQIVAEAAASGHQPVEATASAIELSMHGSHIIRGIDEILAELGAPTDDAGADELPTCESPDGCTNAVTKVATLMSPDGGELKVHACDDCAAHPTSFVSGLVEHGFDIDEDALRELFVQTENDLFLPPDPSTFDAPQETPNA
ncbi:MAG: hypothetical protein QY323_02860 [Patescibacteria group bacterium]|nr:MAG: hypothetical protein QY323_02860 [Patescibacteria group bacterium]